MPEALLSGEPPGQDSTETLRVVRETYGDKGDVLLSELARSEEPRQNARGRLEPTEPCEEIIPKGSIAWFYERFAV